MKSEFGGSTAVGLANRAGQELDQSLGLYSRTYLGT